MSTDALVVESVRPPSRRFGDRSGQTSRVDSSGSADRLGAGEGSDASGAIHSAAAERNRTADVGTVAVRGDVTTVLRDFVELTKPRIVVMILVTTLASSLIAAGGWISLGSMIWLMLGTAMIAGSAGAANQIWERVIDRRMARTARRPLPDGRLSELEAIVFAAALGVAGTLILAIACGWIPAAIGLATWLIYVLLYTPMKTRTAWNTTVGAVAGALPILIGYTAAGGQLTDGSGWLLFGVLAAWQYPHFMAIAWMYRRQYAAAGFCMTTTVEPTGRSAGWQSIVGSMVLLFCGIALTTIPGGWVSSLLGGAAVFAATLPMLRASVRFTLAPNDDRARRMLRSSLIVLPAVLLVATLRVFW